jgi:hypothetical protein
VHHRRRRRHLARGGGDGASTKLVVSLETNWPVFRFNSGTHTCWLLGLLVLLVLVELAALLQALQGLPAPFIVFALFPCCEHVAAAEG